MCLIKRLAIKGRTASGIACFRINKKISLSNFILSSSGINCFDHTKQTLIRLLSSLNC